jgi:hypothetical protein
MYAQNYDDGVIHHMVYIQMAGGERCLRSCEVKCCVAVASSVPRCPVMIRISTCSTATLLHTYNCICIVLDE